MNRVGFQWAGMPKKQPPVNQVASQLSQSLPVVNIEETAPQYTGNPVITLDHVTQDLRSTA